MAMTDSRLCTHITTATSNTADFFCGIINEEITHDSEERATVPGVVKNADNFVGATICGEILRTTPNQQVTSPPISYNNIPNSHVDTAYVASVDDCIDLGEISINQITTPSNTINNSTSTLNDTVNRKDNASSLAICHNTNPKLPYYPMSVPDWYNEDYKDLIETPKSRHEEVKEKLMNKGQEWLTSDLHEQIVEASPQDHHISNANHKRELAPYMEVCKHLLPKGRIFVSRWQLIEYMKGLNEPWGIQIAV